MRARIRRVDMDGYCGRDRHPSREHEGREVFLTEMTVEITRQSDGAFIGHGDQYADPDVIRALSIYRDRYDFTHYYVGVLDDGEVLDLVEHELEML